MVFWKLYSPRGIGTPGENRERSREELVDALVLNRDGVAAVQIDFDLALQLARFKVAVVIGRVIEITLERPPPDNRVVHGVQTDCLSTKAPGVSRIPALSRV